MALRFMIGTVFIRFYDENSCASPSSPRFAPLKSEIPVSKEEIRLYRTMMSMASMRSPTTLQVVQ